MPEKKTVKKTTTKAKAPKSVEVKVVVPKKAKEDNKELQKKIGDFITLELDKMMGDFENLPMNKRWDTLVALLPYATPKMQATDINANMDYDPLSNQLGRLANTFKEDEE